MNKRLSILGVPFDAVSERHVLERLEEACQGKDPLFCVTPNPEICLAAQVQPEFKSLLKKADLSIPDGFGILWAGRYLQGKPSFIRWLVTLFTPWMTKRFSPFPERVTGTDVFREFCKTSPQRRVFLLGASKAVNDKLADKLKAQGVQVVGNYSGSPSQKMEPLLRSMIQETDAEVLFVAFGAPKQEQWIARNLPALPSVRVAMGIGGAFDFIAGHRRRAPKWMRKAGLEWLFRLLIEPRRLGRIFRATVVFPLRVFFWSKSSYNRTDS